MSQVQDTELVRLIADLDLLPPEKIEGSRTFQRTEAAQGAPVPLAAILVREGILPVDLVQRLVAHLSACLLHCRRCGTETSAADLDPRAPFHCPKCEAVLTTREAETAADPIQTQIDAWKISLERPSLIGRVLGGCRLDRKIGQGGMGAVYEALQLSLNRKVAVKILPEYLLHQKGFIERFLREAQTAAQVIHPNVVQVMDTGREDDLSYIIMEYVEGRSLEGILEEEGPIPYRQALVYIRQAARGLAAAAEYNIIHRDIKPDNIRVNPRGVAKVADFGLAKNVEASTQVTATGNVIGTPLYMSPEQAQGEKLDLRSDIYSLGATLFHMLTGQTPFHDTSTLGILQKHIQEEPRRLKELVDDCPPEVDALVQKMLAKDPAKRFQSHEALITSIEQIEGRATTARETVVAPPVKPRSGLPMIGVAVMAVIIIAGGALWWALKGRETSTPSPAILEVLSTPRRATVLLDGEEIGRTPLTGRELPAGDGVLRVTLEGYEPHEERISLAEGKILSRDIDLEPIPPAPATLEITSTPEGATVVLEDQEIGRTPISGLEIPATRGTLRVHLDGHMPHEEEVSLAPGGSLSRDIELTPIAATVRIVTTPVEGARILLDGQPRGRSPLDLTVREAGSHELEIQAQGCRTLTRHIDLQAGQNPAIEIALRPLPAAIVIRTDPPGAAIFVDDRMLGASPIELDTLDPGKHTFRAEKEGYGPSAWDLDLEPGTETRHSVTLERLESVAHYLADLTDVETLIEQGFPLRARDRMEALTRQAGLPDGLTLEDIARVHEVRGRLAEGVPRFDMTVRFGDDGDPIRAASTLGSDPAQAGSKTFTLSVDIEKPLPVAILQFGLKTATGFRLLPDEAMRHRKNAVVPERSSNWSETYILPGDGSHLFILIAVSDDVPLGDLDKAKQQAVAAEAADVLRSIRNWLEGTKKDFGIRTLWIEAGAGGD